MTKPNLNKFLTHPETELSEPASANNVKMFNETGFDRSLTGDERAMMLDVMETLKVESQNSMSMIAAGEVDALVGASTPSNKDVNANSNNNGNSRDARRSPHQKQLRAKTDKNKFAAVRSSEPGSAVGRGAELGKASAAMQPAERTTIAERLQGTATSGLDGVLSKQRAPGPATSNNRYSTGASTKLTRCRSGGAKGLDKPRTLLDKPISDGRNPTLQSQAIEIDHLKGVVAAQKQKLKRTEDLEREIVSLRQGITALEKTSRDLHTVVKEQA